LLDWWRPEKERRKRIELEDLLESETESYKLLERIQQAIERSVAELREIPRERLRVFAEDKGDIELSLTPDVVFVQNLLGHTIENDWPIIELTERGVQEFLDTLTKHAEEVRKRQCYVLPTTFSLQYCDGGELGPPDDIFIDVKKMLALSR
jgi:hypothetical protein